MANQPQCAATANGHGEHNRTGRTQADTGVQMALIYAMHTVAAMFLADVEQCSSFLMLACCTRKNTRTKLKLLRVMLLKTPWLLR